MPSALLTSLEKKHSFLPYLKTPLNLRDWWVWFSPLISGPKCPFRDEISVLQFQGMPTQPALARRSGTAGRGAGAASVTAGPSCPQGWDPPGEGTRGRCPQSPQSGGAAGTCTCASSIPAEKWNEGLFSTGKANTKSKHSPLDSLPLCQPTGSMKCFSQHVTKINRHLSWSLIQQDL